MSHKSSMFLTALCLFVQPTWAQAPEFSVSMEEAEQLRAELKQLKDSLEPLLEALPTGSFDVESLSAELPLEAEKIVSWFRERVNWVPYQGRLRGPSGVLWDRRGNSLDQALLLGQLLENAGYEVRLARRKLSEQEAVSVLPLILNQEQRPENESFWGYDPSVVGALAENSGLSQDELESKLAELERTANEHAAKVRSIVSEQADFLAASIESPDSSSDHTDAAIKSLKDHWWVQYKDKNNWIDADNVVPVDSRGESPISHTPTEYHLLDEIPQGMYQRVTVRVVAERWHKETVDEEVALEFSFIPEAHAVRPVNLVWIPLQAPLDSAPAHLSDSDRFRFTARQEREWLPVFSYGDEMEIQSSIYTDGKVNNNPNLTETTKKFSQAIGAFSGIASEPTSESMLTAVWLDFSIEAPGREKQEIRRTIFDLLGEHKRRLNSVTGVSSDEKILERGFALLGQTTILPSVSWLQKAYVERLLVQDFVDNFEQLVNLIDSLNVDLKDSRDPALTKLEGLHPLPANLFAYHLMRSTINRESHRVFLDQPNIVNQHTYVEERDGRVVFVNSIDIVSNHVGVDPSQDVDPWRARLEQGVLDTVAEVIAGTQGTEGFWTSFAGPENPASLLYESSKLGIKWTAIKDTAGLDRADVELDPDTLARIDTALSQGLAVVAPQKMYKEGSKSAASWWEVNPITGHTLGIGPKGWGVDATGQIVVFQPAKAALVHASAKTIRATIFCTMAGATAQVFAVGLAVHATIQMPYIGGIIVTIGGGHIMQVFKVVFQRCIEFMLFRAP